MFANASVSPAKRRGIVLVVVLGMLGLMALIGVTFATFAGQSLIASRNFSQGVGRPQSEALMDYALAQLINDTNNPLSAIRGHSLLRDMYGNDSVFRGSNPAANPAVETGGLLSSVYVPGSGTQALQFTNVALRNGSAAGPSPTPFYNQVQFQTNIPTTGQYYGLDFTRWIIKFPIPVNGNPNNSTQPATNGFAAQTFEVLEDYAPLGGVHYFTLSNNLTNYTLDPRNTSNNPPYVSSDWSSFLYYDPNFMNINNVVAGNGTPPAYSFSKAAVSLAAEWSGNPFVLDGRNMRAFNGPGLTKYTPSIAVYPFNAAAFANFRLNGSDPDTFGMDEDYDACDLENWFLAIQSADGQIVIPSFHRPGILASVDWTATANSYPNTYIAQASKILRPRQIDNSPLFPADPKTPDSSTGQLTYDIDNDGDGITDSVWLDLGYSTQKDSGGKLYKPLFAFMVLGLNGRLPLNTVGNLQARANADQVNNANAANAAGSTPAITTGQVPYPGIQGDASVPQYYKAASVNGIFALAGQAPYLSSQTYLDAPLWDHASHLGFSVNEINPKFALQNAPSNAYSSASSVPLNSNAAISANVNGNNYSQVDNAGVSVALTQMRNILAGTIPTDLSYPYTGTYPLTAKNTTSLNGDANVVIVNGQYMILPNNMADLFDLNQLGTSGGPYAVARTLAAVPGRWGETSGIQSNSLLPPAGSGAFVNTGGATALIYPGLIYNNPVRAGRSIYIDGTNDIFDDDFDGTDPVLAQYAQATYYYREPSLTGSSTNPPNTVSITRTSPTAWPEFVDTFDTIGQRSVGSERIRQFVTPIDPGGVGRVVDFMSQSTIIGPVGMVKRPLNDYDYGNGYDSRGRTSYFRYFRPAGMPQDIRYPYGGLGSTWTNYAYSPTIISGGGTHRYLMPQLFPAGSLYSLYPSGAAAIRAGASDVHNNPYHGYQSVLTPELAGTTFTQQQISPMAGMPFDWDNSSVTVASGGSPTTGIPLGYPNSSIMYSGASTPPGPPLGTNFINNFAPTINPTTSVLGTAINTSNGPNFGADGNPYTTPTPGKYPIGYGGYPTDGSSNIPVSAPVVNGYLGGTVFQVNGNVLFTGGSLNKDEADEMNLYATNLYDQPYGPSDLEWLYRLQDVDGSTLTSRLSKLAPVSFLNPSDGLTRRRLFSTDSWDTTGWVYANDNPSPYAGAAYTVVDANKNSYSAATDHLFTYNSRFTPFASPSLEIMNQIDGNVGFSASTYSPNSYAGIPTYLNAFNTNLPAVMANPITTEYLYNPTLPTLAPLSTTQPSSFSELYPNSFYTAQSNGPIALPTVVDTSNNNTLFDKPNIPRVPTSNGVLVNGGYNNTMVQVQTPSLAHRDRRINLNMPLPISNDPGEPVRQKWIRETYTLLKAILPPASVDTPEELAALSQFVVNIIDFRDPDCTMTRFVNTDLVVTDVLTKSASNVQPTGTVASGAVLDKTWNVSVPGVRLANSGDSANLTTTLTIDGQTVTTTHFPYDPSLYNPDTTTPFLVQHGMEYSPIAINEVLAYQFQYATGTSYDQLTTNNNNMPPSTAPSYVDQAIFIELVNTLTEEQNNSGSTNNSSAISLQGWDLVMMPDNHGWGRPDPISGDVSSIGYPPNDPTTMKQPPLNQAAPFDTVRHFTFPAPTIASATAPPNAFPIKAVNGTSATAYIVGAYNNTGGMWTYSYTANGQSQTTTRMIAGASPPGTSTATYAEANPYIPNTGATSTKAFDVLLPSTGASSFLPAPLPFGSSSNKNRAKYYWLYLRRPANPFDTGTTAANREMVVVDAMRFPYIDSGDTTTTTGNIGTTATTNYSARRLQPYRGGHLVRGSNQNVVPAADQPGAGSPANGITTICPPLPAHAYGFSEQMSPTYAAGSPNVTGKYTGMNATNPFYHSIGSIGGTQPYESWTHFPFNDRDFSSVAELLLVPGCPPGLFTKQFVEEPYPGNVVGQQVVTTITLPTPPATGGPTNVSTQVTYGTNYATGTDDSDLTPNQPTSTNPNLTGPVKPPVVYTTTTTAAPPVAPSTAYTITTVSSPVGGRKDFNNISLIPPYTVPSTGGTISISPTPVGPTFPYLPDNFYYTAASVAPPPSNYPAYYQNLTTEVGGWTGAGWHKMLEFFEVPSSANGAIGTADGGFNFDWARQDVKPGLLNLNLIVDEEVFAGLFDDPRLNERLAAYASAGSPYIPYVVTQVDTNGLATGFSPMSSLSSVNQLDSPYNGSWYQSGNTNATLITAQFGRGYTVKDPDSQNYIVNPNQPPFPYQQLHGLKAAFSDFLKLRHGGSGFLFGYGAGPTGSGNLTLNTVTNSLWSSSLPLAAEKPYRSLSYPDINYTIMRPASLPPTPLNNQVPQALWGLSSYQVDTVGNNTFVQLNPGLAPMNLTASTTPVGPFQFIGDPGFKNPYLSVQYANPANPTTPPTTPEPSYANAGPPYPVLPYVKADQNVPSAPFPPPIPPTPARRLIQVPDVDSSGDQGTYTDTSSNIYQFPAPGYPSSNASVAGSVDGAGNYTVNQPTTSFNLYSGNASPPTLVALTRAVFQPDNNTPQPSVTYAPSPISTSAQAYPAAASNYLGAGRAPNASALNPTGDHRQHPLYQTEWLQKVMNLTTVRTHQFAVWITVGFFEVVRPGTPELGIPDVLGQEVGLAAGNNVRYRSFFVLDRTKATGFNPYYPGDFRNCVTYRRRIE